MGGRWGGNVTLFKDFRKKSRADGGERVVEKGLGSKLWF